MTDHNPDYSVAPYKNPYEVSRAQPPTLSDSRASDGGNALAANSEARTVAEVKAQIMMARQFPRDPSFSTNCILKECERPSLAESAIYSYQRGNEVVTGPSIRLAEVLARNWGNCTFGYEVLERKINKTGIGSSVIRAYAWDLETNTYITRSFEVKHWRDTKKGGYALTAERDIYELEANMAARRMRACILQMIPGDVIAEAINACNYTASTGLHAAMEDPAKRENLINGTVGCYAKQGVTLADIEEFLQTKVVSWNADHMIRLKETYNAIKDGVVAIGDLFPRLAEKSALVSKAQIKALMEAASATKCQQDICKELQERGYAKFSDIPAAQYDEILSFIKAYKPTWNSSAEQQSSSETNT